MERIICLAIGYVCGLLQSGYLVGKLHHIDIRKSGSGNAGSTNALRVMGWKAGLMTFAGDVLKCFAAVLIVRGLYHGSNCLALLMMYAGAEMAAAFCGVIPFSSQSLSGVSEMTFNVCAPNFATIFFAVEGPI